MQASAVPPSKPVSESELKKAIAEIVRAGDLQTMTARTVRTTLADRFGAASVEGRKDLIKQLVQEEAMKRQTAVTAAVENAAVGKDTAGAEDDNEDEDEDEIDEEHDDEPKQTKKRASVKGKESKSKKRGREEPDVDLDSLPQQLGKACED